MQVTRTFPVACRLLCESSRRLLCGGRHFQTSRVCQFTSRIGSFKPLGVPAVSSPVNLRPNQVACSIYFRAFQVSPKHHIHPILLLIAKPLSKVLAVLTGRGFRKWWQSLPPKKRLYFLEIFKRNQVKFSVGVLTVVGLSALYYETHIQETPITHRKRFIAFTPSQFKKVAEFEFQMQLEEFKNKLLPKHHPACQIVAKVANRLLDRNRDLQQIYDKTWSISVIDSEIQNAFVLPNGQIFVFTGMLEVCANEEQLGAVLSHEMAHCVLGHAAEQVSYSGLIDMALIVVIAAIWAVVPSDSIALLSHWIFQKVVEILMHLPYNRKLEQEADEVGLQLAAKACFDVRESSAFWSKMSLLGEMKGEMENIQWLSTHPSHNARSSNLDSLMDKAFQLREECKCPTLTRSDPRLEVAAFRKIWKEKFQNQTKDKTNFITPLQLK